MSVWEGTRIRFTQTLWPFQPKPGPLNFRAWRRFLADEVLHVNQPLVNAQTKNLQLALPLQEWLEHSSWFQKKWSSFHSTSTQSILIFNNNEQQYKVHNKERKSRKRLNRTYQRAQLFQQNSSTNARTLPQDSTPIDITTFQNLYHIKETWPTQSTTTPTEPTTWESYVNQLQPWEKVLLIESTIWDLTAFLDMMDNNKTIILVPDGGTKGTMGSYGTLAADNNTILATIAGRAYGLTP